MSWFKKPPRKLRAEDRRDLPTDVFDKCPQCGAVLYRARLEQNLFVCPECGHHNRINADDYVALLLDDGAVEELGRELRSDDPLTFVDLKPYPERLEAAERDTGRGEAVVTVAGALDGIPVGLAVMDFQFIGGSMGSVVGEKIARLGMRSLEQREPLLIVSASGGARMMEGILSLMQMAKTSAVLARLHEAAVPYVSIVTNPTMGGVTASYAMLGDIIVAEPGALVGFAGPRVIEQTIKQELPDGFQRSEFLLEHGMVDAIVDRRELKSTVSGCFATCSVCRRPRPTGTAGTAPAAAVPSGAGGERARLQGAGPHALPPADRGIRWGLERTERLLAAVGDPHRTYATIHVGGTNGKGSVAASIASVLQHAGLRTGLYTSPHLCTFRERIQIDSEAIAEDALVAAAGRLWPRITAESPSFFEATTAIAFLALADAGVDVAVVEVGLGGRLDATNVVTPEVVALTNVSLDHVELLGDSIEAVAREKAGILKPGAPAVTAETGAAALAVFRERAAALGVSLHLMQDRDVRIDASSGRTHVELTTASWGAMAVETPLLGEHQGRNAALAVCTLDLLPERIRPAADAVRAGLANVRWPGRLQREQLFGRTWIFDVAHNVAGVEALAAAVRALDPPRPLVALVGVLGDKDWRGMLGPIADLADRLILTLPPTAPAGRRWDPAGVLEALALRSAVAQPDFTLALEAAHAASAGDAGGAGTVLVTGSFHTVGDALSALGRAPYGSDVTLPLPSFAA